MSPPRPATAFSIAFTTSTVPFMVPAPMPYAAPAARNTTAMKTISPFMNGESPMSAPVAVLRSGAPGGSASSGEHGERAEQGPRRELQAARLLRVMPVCSAALLAAVGAEPRLDDPVVHHGHHDREQQHRGDGEPEVRGQRDREVRIQDVDGVVGDPDEDAVQWLDEHVDREDGGDRREGRGESGQGVAAHAEVRGRTERNEDQVTGVGRDARHDADEHEDVGEGPGRRDEHQLADERRDETRGLGHTDAQHGDDDDADRGEAHEVLDHARVHEPDAVGREQAADADRGRFEQVGLRVDGLHGQRWRPSDRTGATARPRARSAARRSRPGAAPGCRPVPRGSANPTSPLAASAHLVSSADARHPWSPAGPPHHPSQPSTSPLGARDRQAIRVGAITGAGTAPGGASGPAQFTKRSTMGGTRRAP